VFAIDCVSDRLRLVLAGEFHERREFGVELCVGDVRLAAVIDVELDAFEHDLVEGLALLAVAASVEPVGLPEQLECERDALLDEVVLFAG